MAITHDCVEQATSAYHGALLGGLSKALGEYGISSRVISTIRLRLVFGDYPAPRHVRPVLEVRGADRGLRATVSIVRGAREVAYSVRPVDGDRYYLFPVSEHEIAVAFVVGRARDWQLTR